MPAEPRGLAAQAVFIKKGGRGVVSRRRESVVLYEKMRAGPSESPCGRRLQTARSCFSQKLRW
jgi:hypothetical protein